MPKLSDEKLRELLSDKFADFEVDVDRNMWEHVGNKIVVPKTRTGRFVKGTLATVTIALMFSYVATRENDVKQTAPVVETPAAIPAKEIGRSVVQKPVITQPIAPPITTASMTTATAIESGTEPVLLPPLAAPEISIAINYPNPNLAQTPTVVVPAKERTVNTRLNFSFGAFANYKQVQMNRFDRSFLSNFKPGDASRFGVQLAGTLSFTRFETGLSYTHYTSSFSYDEFNASYDRTVRKEMNSVFNIVGLRGGFNFNTRRGKLHTGVEWQVIRESGTVNRTHSILAGRLGYSLNVRSWENMDLVFRPVVTTALTTINMGTMRSRPYTIGFDVVLSRKVDLKKR